MYELSVAVAPSFRTKIECALIAAYRSSYAHGVTDTEDVYTEWDELGALISNDHGLRELALSALRSKIHVALKELTYAGGLALWVAYGSAIDFLEGSKHDAYDSFESNPDGLSEVTEHICVRVIDTAVTDWEGRPPKRDVAEDRAYLEAMIDGKVDLFASDIITRLEPMFTVYENNFEMMTILNAAADVYSEAAIDAAKAALATM